MAWIFCTEKMLFLPAKSWFAFKSVQFFNLPPSSKSSPIWLIFFQENWLIKIVLLSILINMFFKTATVDKKFENGDKKLPHFLKMC